MAKKPKAPKPPATGKTVPKQLTPWQPGQSGNPAGRPKGARNKLGEVFIEALYEDFLVSGKDAIAMCRLEKPDVYVKVCADLLRKEILVSRDDEAFDKLSDDEIDQVIADALARRGNLERERDRLTRQEGKSAAPSKAKPDRVH